MKRVILLSICLIFSSPVIAGNPFMIDFSGGPILWEGGLKWTYDGGALNNNVPNKIVASWVRDLFGVWQGAALEDVDGRSLDVVALGVEEVGSVDYDITARNYDSIEFADATAVIVFDATGEIIDDMFGEKSKDYIVGFASPFTTNGSYFGGGIVVINGLFFDAVGSDDLGLDEFKAAILHELGHLLNLDHTQANIEAAERFEGGDSSLSDEIPTMYPVLYTGDQLNLHTDDVVALAEQYPNENYLSSFCKISGELVDSNGSGFQGADVVARAKDPVYEWSDVRTFVSGVLYPADTESGAYVLGGLVPGREYSVGYRGIDPLFSGGSSIAPYDPPRTGIVGGVISEAVVACGGGGENMDVSKVEITEDVNVLNNTAGDSGDTDPVASPSGGCSLIP